MTRPRNTVDLQDLLDGPADTNPRSQKRTTRFYRNDISKLVSDIDINFEHENDVSSGLSQQNISDSERRRRTSQPVARNTDSARPNTAGRKKKPSKPGHTAKSQPKTPLRPLTSAEHTNVTCRFVVHDDSPVSSTTLDVDHPIPTKQVWRVFSPVQECPICLESAEVPRMLGCGHLMCFHCMLNHRKYSETPDICPICGEVVSLNPNRATPVSFLGSTPELLPKEDEEVVLTLMSRPVDSAVALPVNLGLQSLQRSGSFPLPDMILWTRVCEGDIEYAKRELSSELKYLIGASKTCAAEFGSDEEGYTEAAADLKKYIHSLNVGGTSTTTTDQPPRTSNHKPQASSEFIYYYQTSFESPTLYTISPLDVSILKAAYGSFDNFPSSLITKVQNIEYAVLDRTNEKKLKFLSHVPEQTQIAFLECDWNGVVNPEVLLKFKSKLDERERAQRRKRAHDHAERQRAQDAIDKMFKIEVADAMLPHEHILDLSQGSTNFDAAQLPTLKKSNLSVENEKRREETLRRQEEEKRKEYESLMNNAYVTQKKGKKKVVLRF